MFRFTIPTILMLAISMTGFAQTAFIKGLITEKTNKKPVAGATVSLLLEADSSLVKNVVSDSVGLFLFDKLANDSFIVTVNTVNFQQYVSFITIRENNSRDMGILLLDQKGKDLDVVTIVSRAPAAIQKGDTSQFSASQYKVNPDATTEDLIKKMPGITVARDGTVTAQGETVKKVTIDGKDFFGDDASAALKNLPSEVVDKIQVFDRLSDQAQLTGFDDGNSQKAINIVTKSGIKNGQFGRAYAGIGTDEKYTAGGNMSFFKGSRRISIVGNFNNINQQNFGSQDLLGVTSNGNRGGGGGGQRGPGGGGMGGFGGGGENFSVGQSSGISKTNALGINFSNQYTKKVSLSGSYFYNNSNNKNQFAENTETFAGAGKNQFSNQVGKSVTNNNNHRINMRMEYKIDSNNSIFIIPGINFQNNNYQSNSAYKSYYGINDSVSTSLINSNDNRNGFNIRNNIMFRHAFAKKGRSISIGINTGFSKNSSESITDAAYRFFDNGIVEDSVQNQFADNIISGQNYGGSLAYTEPVGKKGQLQFEYNPSIQKNNADQQTFLYDGQKYSMFDSSLSNRFDNNITTQRGGISYRFSKNKDDMFSAGFNFQQAKLESQRVFPTVSSVNQSFFDFLPNAMWRKKISAVSNLRLFYRASVNFPSVNQLQDVVNPTNPLRVSSGNPLLKQSNTQFLGGRYSYTNSKTSKSFFANLFVQTARNYISNATFIAKADSVIQQGIVLKKGSQLSKPVNLDGYKSLRSFFTYSMPLKFIKTTLNLNSGFSYSKLPGLVNYRTTTTDNFVYNAGVALASNISEYVDFNLNYNAGFNEAKNSFNASLNNRYINQSAGLALNLLSKKGWFIQNDVNNQTYSGLSAGLNQSFWLWNAAIGKKFGKNKAGELKLSVFDLLKQNQSITRTVDEKGIRDSQSDVLQQYFMLTYSYNLKNFGVAKPANKNSDDNQGKMGVSGF